MSQILRLTDRNFNEEVSQSKVPMLVEFSASWCVPSQQQKPLMEELAMKYSDRLKFGELNVDQNPMSAAKYQIMGCPTFILLNSGNIEARRVGAQSKKQLLEMLPPAIDNG
ncbi:thioredoxin family protein [Chloroflexota bacterium]